MGPLSDALESLLKNLGISTATAPAATPMHQEGAAPFIIPPSGTLQRLTQPDVQQYISGCLVRLGVQPTEAQWKMILAPTASTCVVAGAGSGKSTTLILRLLVLHKVLGIPLDQMHVFSFTRASTQDFQKKLVAQLAHWEEVIEEKTVTDLRRAALEKSVQRTVSTFHSVLARLCREALPGGDIQRGFFDLLDNQLPEETVFTAYNPFVTPTLSDRQVEILTAAHRKAYEHSDRYRALIRVLVLEQERQRWLRAADALSAEEHLEQWKWESLLKQEKTYHGFSIDGRYAPSTRHQDQKRFAYIDPYRAAVADRLHAWGVAFEFLPPFSIHCPIPGGRPGWMYASFKVGEYLWLHIERYPYPGAGKGEEFGLSFHERDRRRFIALYSSNSEHHKVFKPEDFDLSGAKPVLTTDGDFKLQTWLNLNGHAAPSTSAPALRMHVPGDPHRAHLAELLYQEGTFLESLGLEAEDLHWRGSKLDPQSAAIAELLPLFWQAFRAELEQQGLLRFHDVLTALRYEPTLRSIRERLQHLKHLFIDEFQDISPELVDWLAKTLRVHVEDGNAEVSVTAIGDDYQSIYGWRGSHPAFLMRFEQYFPADLVSRIVLGENFRSRQPIIDAAEAVLEPIKQKIPKHGESTVQPIEQGRTDPVRLIEAPLSWESPDPQANLWHTFSTYVAALLHDLETANHLASLVGERKILSIFILARTNQALEQVPRRPLGAHLLQMLRQQRITRFHEVQVHKATFHRSKGLEADFVLALEDAQLPDEHPLRDLGFSQTPFLGKGIGTYTQNVGDEARRLAYVALTRARFGVLWVPIVGGARLTEDEEHPAGNGTGPSSASISDKGCFVLVKHYLQAQGRM